MVNELIQYIVHNQTMTLIYYLGISIPIIMCWILLIIDWREFERMRIVMGPSQLIWSILTTITLYLEPIVNSHGIGLAININEFNWLITPTNTIGLIGLCVCGWSHLRLNHRIWRTEFPTRPYPEYLEG